MNLANSLTLFRAAAVFPYALLLLRGETIAAGVLFALAALTDLLDGYVARRRQEETALGRVLDPIADKMLTMAALIVLAANGTLYGLLFIGVMIIAMRELWVAGLREGLIHAGAELPVTMLAKTKTSAQLAALFVLTLGPSTPGYILFWIAALLTLVTGAQYTRQTFKVLALGEAD